MLYIPSHIYGELICHLKSEYPNEGCGVLLGKEGRVTEILKLTNIEKRPDSFQCDPYEQLAFLKRIDEEDIELLCIYHSHPEGECLPSEKDIRLARLNCYYMIVLLKNLSDPVTGLFSIDGGSFIKKEIRVF